MAQRLKRWESPRREGRNDKGRGGSARQRQKRKQFQALRQKLKDQSTDSNNNQPKHRGGSKMLPLIFWRPDLTISCDQTWVASAN
ncbi:MAG: hypothetical protein ACP5RH_21275 [Leptodesmis sp.]|uniref:hypothetical protein n=1 Tax=Leptodesmis TaxID=2664261 RepID=UPI001F2CF089|nr:hypothetical protein [Leptodesmis sichuanensis]UIE40732.1 hypothetical protein KIK02_10860 [Leptodesmis sichuanensis A121]